MSNSAFIEHMGTVGETQECRYVEQHVRTGSGELSSLGSSRKAQGKAKNTKQQGEM